MQKLEKRRASTLKANPHQLRRSRDKAELLARGKSVMKKQFVPLIIRPDGAILDGEGRWLGVMLIDPDFELDCIVTDEDVIPAQFTEIQLITALHKTDLTAYEQYLGCKEWLKLNPKATAKELAEKIDRDPSHVMRIHSLDKCNQRIKEEAAAGNVGLSSWYAMSKAAAEDQGALLDAHLAGASRDDLENQNRKRRNESKQTVRVSSIRCPLPSGTTVVVKGNNISLEDAIEAMTQLLKAMKTASQDGIDGKTFARVCADKAKKG